MKLNVTIMPEDMRYIFGYVATKATKFSLLVAELPDASLTHITNICDAIKAGENIELEGVDIPSEGYARVYLYNRFSLGMKLAALHEEYSSKNEEVISKENIDDIKQIAATWIDLLSREPFKQLFEKREFTYTNLFKKQFLHELLRNVSLNYWNGKVVSMSLYFPYLNNTWQIKTNPSFVLFNLPTEALPAELRERINTREMLELGQKVHECFYTTTHSYGRGTSFRRNLDGDSLFMSTYGEYSGIIPAFAISKEYETVNKFLYNRTTNSLSMLFQSNQDTFGAELTEQLTGMQSPYNLDYNSYDSNYRHFSGNSFNIFVNDLLVTSYEKKKDTSYTSIPVSFDFITNYLDTLTSAQADDLDLNKALLHKKENALSPLRYIQSKKRYNTVMTEDKYFFFVKKTDEFKDSSYQANISRLHTQDMTNTLALPIQFILSSAVEIPSDINAIYDYSGGPVKTDLCSKENPTTSNSHIPHSDDNLIKAAATTYYNSLKLDSFKESGNIECISTLLTKSKPSYYDEKFRGAYGSCSFNLSTGKIDTRSILRQLGIGNRDKNVLGRAFENNFLWTDTTGTLSERLSNYWGYEHLFVVPVELFFKLPGDSLAALKELVKCRTVVDYANWYLAKYALLCRCIDTAVSRYEAAHVSSSKNTITANPQIVQYIKLWLDTYHKFFTHIITLDAAQVKTTSEPEMQNV